MFCRVGTACRTTAAVVFLRAPQSSVEGKHQEERFSCTILVKHRQQLRYEFDWVCYKMKEENVVWHLTGATRQQPWDFQNKKKFDFQSIFNFTFNSQERITD